MSAFSPCLFLPRGLAPSRETLSVAFFSPWVGLKPSDYPLGHRGPLFWHAKPRSREGKAKNGSRLGLCPLFPGKRAGTSIWLICPSSLSLREACPVLLEIFSMNLQAR